MSRLWVNGRAVLVNPSHWCMVYTCQSILFSTIASFGHGQFFYTKEVFLQPIVQELVSEINSTNNSVLSGYQETVQSGCARIHNICKLNHNESAWSHQKVQIIYQFGISGCKWTFLKLIKLLYTPSSGPPGSFKSNSLISPSINSRK